MLNSNGNTRVSQACLDNDLDEVIKCIKDNPKCITDENWNFTTARHIAVKYAYNMKIVEAILNVPVTAHDLNAENQYHCSVYDYANNRGNHLSEQYKLHKTELLRTKPEVLKLLISNGR
jgi:hypothetical protein